MTKASDNDFPSVLITEGTPATPAAGHQRLGIRSSDHAIVTVNSSGTVTAYSSSASAYVQIFDSTLGGTATSIDTSTVLAGYNHLRAIVQARTDRAGQVFEGVDIQFNGDTGANYDSTNVDAPSGASPVLSGSESFAGTAGLVASVTGASATANVAGIFEILVPNYGNTTFHKEYTSYGGVKYGTAGGNLHVVEHFGNWRSTAAITRIVIKTRNGSNFIAGTRMTVYGML